MWQLGIVSPLIIASFVLAACGEEIGNNQNNSPLNDFECVPRIICNNGLIVHIGIVFPDFKSGGPRFCGDTRRCPSLEEECCRRQYTKETVVNTNKCGQSKPLRKFEIDESKNQSQYGEFPWMVAIWADKYNDGKLVNSRGVGDLCTGTLINEKTVLTAIHCVDSIGDQQLKVRVGVWDLRKTDGTQDRDVVEIIRHEQYYDPGLRNNYCLLILESPVTRGENVDFVCLPDANTVTEDRCIVNGWGDNAPRPRSRQRQIVYQFIPRKVQLPIVNARDCQSNPDVAKLVTLTCAGGEGGQDACKGYGAAPLLCPVRGDPSRYIQVGFLSRSMRCGAKGFPGLYTSVADGRQWIDEKLADNELDTTSYQYSP